MSDRRRCDRCGQYYEADLGPKKEHEGMCPALLCVAIDWWDADRWAGAADMAECRKAAGVPLNDIDIEALHRARTGRAR